MTPVCPPLTYRGSDSVGERDDVDRVDHDHGRGEEEEHQEQHQVHEEGAHVPPQRGVAEVLPASGRYTGAE